MTAEPNAGSGAERGTDRERRPRSLADNGPIVVVGGGQAGSLMTLYLARQGHQVHVLESRPDLRRVDIDAGKSINLALATRGIVPLKEVGVYERVEPILVPMAGRMVHETDGDSGLQRYGLSDDDVIHAVSRSDLNAILLDAAEATGNVRISFDVRCREIDFTNRLLTVTDYADGERASTVPFGTLFGCDGASSEVRDAMLAVNGGTSISDPLGHGYKELNIAAGPGRSFQIEPNALHIWPRGEFMLIALANPEGDFTVTLFMPNEGGEDSFAALQTADDVERFFKREFPDFVPLVPDLAEQFFDNPTGLLSTIRNTGWSVGADAVLVGDAAHAIVPFHGQGMNLGMESCRLLDRIIREHPDDLEVAFERYETDRKPDAEAIADMALENYVEMRSGVVDPSYLIKRELALEMERRFPDKIAARYGMVMFSTRRYAEVKKRAERQNEIFAELTAGVETIDRVDFDRAAELVSRLSPLPAPI
ncbi:MAG: FAD-dependent oxidoreductase [Acidimicrobiales bacterium]